LKLYKNEATSQRERLTHALKCSSCGITDAYSWIWVCFNYILVLSIVNRDLLARTTKDCTSKASILKDFVYSGKAKGTIGCIYSQ